MFRVEIRFQLEWYPVGPLFTLKGDAEWAIATWRMTNGSNNKDTGFRVIEVLQEKEDGR